MSFLNELKLQYEVSHPPTLSLEEINISLEGLSLSKIKELVVKGIKKVKDFFIKIFKWIKEKVLTFLKSKRTKEIIEKAKNILNIKDIIKKGISIGGFGKDKDKNLNIDESVFNFIYTDEDLRFFIERFFDLHSGKEESKVSNFLYLFNFKNGELVDLNKVYKYLNKQDKDIEEIIKLFKNKDSLNDKERAKLQKVIAAKGHYDTGLQGLLNNIPGNNLDNYHKLGINKITDKITKEKLFKWVEGNNFESMVSDAENYYNKMEIKVSNIIKELKSDLRDFASNNYANDDYLEDSDKAKLFYKRKFLDYLYSFQKRITIPANITASYIQLLDYICNKFSSKEYLIDPNPPKYKHLYHLSDNPSLIHPERKQGAMTPLIPLSGLYELLPPRISFAEDVLSCCYGIPRYFNGQNALKNKISPEFDSRKGYAKDLYLYEGIPTDETKFLKPAFVQGFIGDAHMSNEICVLSDISIKKVGKVRIWYNKDLSSYDDRKFIRYEFVEE